MMAKVDPDVNVMAKVDPSWFESPAERLCTSGGTAPFFRLTLTDEGLTKMTERQQRNGKGVDIDRKYWIGKDLSHAEDERDFYIQILRIRAQNISGENDKKKKEEDIGLLTEFMFDFLGVLEISPDDDGNEKKCQLLVMKNLRIDQLQFRMIDLKIGEKTAQSGWKGKSRLRAMKHHLMDGLSNSSTEGYRLAGFEGCPEVVDSMDPLIDILANDNNINNNTDSSNNPNLQRQSKTLWGKEIKEPQFKMAKRILLNSLDGTGVFRYFLDLHTEDSPSSYTVLDHYLPVEISEIVSHELMAQLICLSVKCHQVITPQKWIGSSVALTYDAGLFPDLSSTVDHSKEKMIRSNVTVNIFDWGRSELLTRDQYQTLTPVNKNDREKFWDFYIAGVDRLSYNATRFYYHQFTNSTRWTKLTLKVMDFDSMSSDDFIGTASFPLPDPLDTSAVLALKQSRPYKLIGAFSSACGSIIYCSVSWLEFTSESRLLGAWRVKIEHATNLPPMDLTGTSDAYCIVMASDGDGDDDRTLGRQFHQRTCIKAASLNPRWDEIIDLPVRKKTDNSSLISTLKENGISSITDYDMPNFFQCDNRRISKDNMKRWTNAVTRSY
jgi:hypothetical protein